MEPIRSYIHDEISDIKIPTDNIRVAQCKRPKNELAPSWFYPKAQVVRVHYFTIMHISTQQLLVIAAAFLSARTFGLSVVDQSWQSLYVPIAVFSFLLDKSIFNPRVFQVHAIQPWR